MGNRRFEMHEYRHILARMRLLVSTIDETERRGYFQIELTF